MMQAQAFCEIAQAARDKGLSVWCYTGYTLEQLWKQGDAHCLRLLSLVDVLVDGPYVARLRSLDLLYCGSTNQRLIDMPRTNASGEIRLYEPPVW